ncbi:NMD protein affecting ribosome stability and mRNA decay [Alkalibacillus flavidus]|uniref:NMD protein affecting ribosome stability and mRNA decay n=1 Tax=Alkalibacillus flavidus TaxID=546021 RepID=A0ABV2KVE8_9BACI
MTAYKICGHCGELTETTYDLCQDCYQVEEEAIHEIKTSP